MKQVARLVLAAVLAAGMAAAAGAVEQHQPRDAMAWLDRMNAAFGELSYHGTFSYLHGRDLATLQVTHVVMPDGSARERLVHLNGKPREFVRYGDKLACLLQPDDDMLELAGSIPAGPFARAFTFGFAAVPDSYALELGPPGRIAGRQAVQLRIRPRDDLRYGYDLWLDAASGLMLRSDLLDSDGLPLEIFQFTDIMVGDMVGDGVPAIDIDTSPGPGWVVHMVDMADRDGVLERPSAREKWSASWLPDGFMLNSWDVRRGYGDSALLSSAMYTDGLASVSVFVEPYTADIGQPTRHTVRNGATVAVSEVQRDQAGAAYLITVVGEVPVATARRIAESVRPI